MQEELNQFEMNQVWELVSKPSNYLIISTKWVFKNKNDENDTIVRNKARLEPKGLIKKKELIMKKPLHPKLDLRKLECYLYLNVSKILLYTLI